MHFPKTTCIRSAALGGSSSQWRRAPSAPSDPSSPADRRPPEDRGRPSVWARAPASSAPAAYSREGERGAADSPSRRRRDTEKGLPARGGAGWISREHRHPAASNPGSGSALQTAARSARRPLTSAPTHAAVPLTTEAAQSGPRPCFDAPPRSPPPPVGPAARRPRRQRARARPAAEPQLAAGHARRGSCSGLCESERKAQGRLWGPEREKTPLPLSGKGPPECAGALRASARPPKRPCALDL